MKNLTIGAIFAGIQVGGTLLVLKVIIPLARSLGPVEIERSQKDEIYLLWIVVSLMIAGTAIIFMEKMSENPTERLLSAPIICTVIVIAIRAGILLFQYACAYWPVTLVIVLTGLGMAIYDEIS